ncbi:MAG: hypothetical protein ABL957_10740 [Parvularculaceae bacterium]
MGYSIVAEKYLSAASGAGLAALVEAFNAPQTALLSRLAGLGLRADAAISAPVAHVLGVAALAALAMASLAYVRPLSRKAAFACGFCVVAVLAILTP